MLLSHSGHTSRKSSLFQPPLFQEKIEKYAQATLKRFRAMTRMEALFHLLFSLLSLTEIVFFITFFSFFTHTSILAFTLAGFFLTAFTYLILHFYFQSQKPEQLTSLQRDFTEKCRDLIPYNRGSSQHHLSLAHALYNCVAIFHSQEYFYYPTPSGWESLSSVIQKLSCWSHWKELHKMKELLLQQAIQEHYELIKNIPTDLEAHASLAQAHLLLSKLYLNPQKLAPEEEIPWVPKEYLSEAMGEKLLASSWRAIEEFKIVDSFAPNDPWVHAQLRTIYADLDLRQEEIAICEKLLKLVPKDRDLLFRLGVLYLKEGLYAKGLTLYDKLLKEEDPRAEELISHYGNFLDA